jgi:putative SOS response-associated peptidase YedK
MCSRFVRASDTSTIAERFSVRRIAAPDIPPSYNIAPNQWVLIVSTSQERQLFPARWGFLPSWAKDPSMGNRMINARSETVATKPAFRHAFRSQRCLVIADGFYEWHIREGKKYPVYVRLKPTQPFGFAGLHNVWQSPDGSAIPTCTIITTEANDLLMSIHDRMPVILPRGEKEDIWLDPLWQNQDEILSLLRPYPPEEMELYPVSRKVNSPGYDSSENIRPLPA